MTAFNYTKSAATAWSLLSKFGKSLTFSLPDTVEDGPPGVPGITIPGRIITGQGVKLQYSNSEIDGELIQSGDAKIIIEATTEPPENGMRITIDDSEWRVMDFMPLAPADTVVIYTLQIRRF